MVMLEDSKMCFPKAIFYPIGNVDKEKAKLHKDVYRAEFNYQLNTMYYGLAILMFRCCGSVSVTMSGEPPTGNETICGIPANIVYEVCNKYNQITPDDLEEELFNNVTEVTVTALYECANIILLRLECLLAWPNVSIDANEIVGKSPYLHSLLASGCISKDEACNYADVVSRFAAAFKNSVTSIKNVYKKYKAGNQNHKVVNKHNKDDDKKIFEISSENKPVIKYVYEFLNGDAFNLTETGFCSIVEAADFSSVFGKMLRNKAKIKYMISYLSEVMGEKWYEHAVKSIGFSKSECSGAKAADYIKNKLDKSKIRRVKTGGL